MKTPNKLIALALVGLLMNLAPVTFARQTDATPASWQAPSFRVGMYRVKNSLTMRLLIEKKLIDQLIVLLLDKRGRVIHKEALGRTEDKYARSLNFGEAGDGTYTLVVRNGSERITREIQLSSHTLYEMPKRLLLVEN
jgi:hypothetical protein